MKTLLLVCDFEEFSLPLDFGKEISEELMMGITYEGIQQLQEFILNHQIKTTFFVTEKVVEAFPKLLKELFEQGHEIGFHSSINYKNNINAREIINNIRCAKEKIENEIRGKIYGFKNHKLMMLPSFIVKEAGFTYDNTCHPTYVPGRYCNFHKGRNINLECGLINVPISVTPILRFPFSWVWFRNFGLNYIKFCTSWVLLAQDYTNIYFHSWDFADIEKNLRFSLPFMITRNSGKKMLALFDYYINWCKSNDIKTETIHHYLIQKNLC